MTKARELADFVSAGNPLADGVISFSEIADGNAVFGDNSKAIFGAGSDLQIYHNGTDSFIDEANASGWLYIRGNDIVIGKYTGEIYFKGIADGAVELYHDNAVKLATTATGIDVTGTVTVDGTVDGRDVAADGTKLDGIESGATADQTASEILTAIKTVDGASSGLDADLLDGQEGSYYLNANNFVNMPAGYTGWTISDGTNSESVTDGSTITFSGASYNTGTNTVTINTTPTTAQVLSATSGASYGAVGSYAFLTTYSNVGENGTYADSSLYWGAGMTYFYGSHRWEDGTVFSVTSSNPSSQGSPSGTWRALGSSSIYGSGGPSSKSIYAATLFLRIS